ncbi:tRNA (guanine(37)-N1)-methyltransferase 1-like [Papaver somniferum]|uniref:tRNA (guanine(37)-N1)-methyltransferase 1-like n=1 Tax=Papaver somniferum TaxID=3469 RepID=UPI000E6F507B|nr:tRNA (guanine(37)-N1)-methyltransferase 1-like [Papaver somniferum]XP_026448286.1 tRNA (guanine(37)-N1)-methyltransferase 1-like [Papaver somniferum]
MATKLVLQSHPLPVFLFSANHFLRKQSPHNSSLFTSFSTVSSPQTLTLTHHIIYGPSLHKGTNPSQSSAQVVDEDEREVINKESFSRVFELSALRVPAEECFALENRLRGHLLNWPRVRNIARVPGDEMEDEFKKILPEKNDTGEDEEEKKILDSLDRRLYGKADDDGEELSPVLYRDNIMKSFNSRGYVNFRNVAKISRPKKKNSNKRRDEGEGSDREKRIGKNDFAVVEVVGNENDDFSGLLGEDFKGGRWRGSTRLLLLDENLANKNVEELPEAVKAVITGELAQSRKTIPELVQCKLTLFYNYWQMNEILEALLPRGAIVPSAFETIGHIAHLNLRDEHLPCKKLIAQVVLDKNKPKIQTVVNKVESIQNEYRTMQLEVLAGNNSLVATVTENGIRFHVDLAAVYWNSKLATERQRLVNRFTSSDIVCDVFSGVGPIALAAAKKVKLVYANDLNPAAVEYLERNCVLNKLERKIKVSNMDGRRFIVAMFNSHKAKSITQVVMNLPNDAVEYLDVFRGIFIERPKEMISPMPMIHVYGFSNASDPEFDFHQRIRISLKEVAVEVEIHRVRHVAPGKWMLCASFVLPEIVAFASLS